MSKPVKQLMIEEYKSRFGELEGAMLIDIRGTSANDTNTLRADLAPKGVKITLVKNDLAKSALADSDLAMLFEGLEGSNALAYATSEDVSVISVARELVAWAKEIETIVFRGAVLDGILFDGSEIERLSKFPTREEAQAKVVQLVLSPAQNLIGATTAPACNLAGILKTIEEKLEKGEALEKIA